MTVVNAYGTTTSEPAVVAVIPTGFAATHAVVGWGYVAGSTVTFTNTFTYPGSLSSLGWHVLLPEGWSFVSSSSGDVQPDAGGTSVLDWAWITAPASGSTFTYTLRAPANATGAQSFVALMIARQSGTEYALPRRSAPERDSSSGRDRGSNLKRGTRWRFRLGGRWPWPQLPRPGPSLEVRVFPLNPRGKYTIVRPAGVVDGDD